MCLVDACINLSIIHFLEVQEKIKKNWLVKDRAAPCIFLVVTFDVFILLYRTCTHIQIVGL